MTNTPEERRAWANGSLNQVAATELLLRGFSGRFAEPGWPWMKDEAGQPWIDFGAIPDEVGGLSSGEQRFQMIAGSLGGEESVALSAVVPGLGRSILDLVLGALPTLQVPTLTPKCTSRPKASCRSNGSKRCIRGPRKRRYFAWSTAARNS